MADFERIFLKLTIKDESTVWGQGFRGSFQGSG